MSLTILVVDDDHFFRSPIVRKLSDLGYEVLTADNGHGALAQVNRKKPDLLILDIHMPDMDGFELLQELKPNRDFPAFVMTGGSSFMRPEHCLKTAQYMGADKLYEKPFPIHDLVQDIKAVEKKWHARKFYESIDRVFGSDADWERFLSSFYELFLNENEDIQAYFAHTDMKRQVQMLRESLKIMIQAVNNVNEMIGMDEICYLHFCDKLKVPIEYFDVWQCDIVETVAKFDPEFDQDVAKAWDFCLGQGVNYFKATVTKAKEKYLGLSS